MAVRWSRLAPQLALTPALAVTLVGFVGSIGWTVYMSFTRSRRFPDYAIDPDDLRPVQAAVRQPGLDDGAREPRRPRARHRRSPSSSGSCSPPWSSARSAARGLPHRLPLPARRLAHRHRAGLAVDVQPLARHRGLPAPARVTGRALQLAGGAARPRCTRSSSPRSGTGRLLHGADAGRA